jgi:hypothetical protein
MFASVTIDNSIELPYFPEELDRDKMGWQSKRGLDVYGGPYRVTSDGRLEKKQTSYRDKTDGEKQAEAEKWGCDSWDEYVQLYEESDSGLTFPDELDWDEDENGYGDTPPIWRPEQTVDEEWWGDQSFHGTFEVHEVIKRDPISYNVMEDPVSGEEVKRPEEHALDTFFEYELRFKKGDLTDVVFMGERHCRDDPIGDALDAIEEWRDWRQENPDEW